MNKKRFWILNVLTENSGIKDGDKLLSFDDVVELLNELHEENQALKKEIGDLGELHAKEITKIEYAFDEEILQLEEKNKQLKQSIDTKISVEDNYRKHLEIYSDQYFKLKEYISELLTKKYNHYEEMKKTIRNKEAQRVYTNILKVIKDLQEDVDTEWGS